MNIDLTAIIQAVIGLLAALITYRLIPWIKARTTAQQQEMLNATIKTLVFAAEQVLGSGTGEEKMDYVKQELERRGFTVDVVAIEAAVRQMGEFEIKKDMRGHEDAVREGLPGQDE